MLRNFLIIGAQRCGTTSLYNYITAHPRVVKHKAKMQEIHFFDWQYSKGISWYRTQFKRLRNTGKITGESSPSYIFDSVVPSRVYKHKPEVKLIVLLRNPARRAYSHYYHNKARNAEPLTFRRALDAEEDRQDLRYRQQLEWAYKARGRYAEQLKRWFKWFHRDQMLIIKSENLFDNTGVEIQRVFEFLEVEPYSMNDSLYDYHIYNQQKYRLYASTYDHLMDYFEPYNKQLYELLGVDLGWDE